MRILFVQPYVTFPGVMDDTLPGMLARRGHEVLVATFSRQRLPESSVKNLKFTSTRGVSLKVPLFVTEFPFMINLGGIVEEFEPDVIHANNLPFITTYQATKVAKKVKVGVVVHVNGVVMERSKLLNALQKLFLRIFAPSIFGDANRIICVNAGDALEIERYRAPPEKIRIIPNAVDVEKFSPAGDKQSNTLLWSGRFVKQKGLEYLFEAMDILVRKKGMTDLTLFLTGDGPLMAGMQVLVKRLGLEKNVVFLGRVSRQEVAMRMRSCAVYVLPSVSEAMPTYALLEAMASGMAPIITDIPGSAAIFTSLSQAGLIVPPKNPIALAEAIEMLLRDEGLRSRLGRNARDLVSKKYNLEFTTTSVESLYGELVSLHDPSDH